MSLGIVIARSVKKKKKKNIRPLLMHKVHFDSIKEGTDEVMQVLSMS